MERCPGNYCYICIFFKTKQNYTWERAVLMAYSHGTRTGPVQGQGTGKDQWVSVYYAEMFTLVQRQGQGPGPIVTYCSSSVLCPGPVQCDWAIINEKAKHFQKAHISMFSIGGSRILRREGMPSYGFPKMSENPMKLEKICRCLSVAPPRFTSG